MKLCKASPVHVGNMDVAYAALGFFVDDAAIILNPFSIAGGLLFRERFDSNHVRLFRSSILDSELHLVICLVHQQFLCAASWSYSLPIDGAHGVSYTHI